MTKQGAETLSPREKYETVARTLAQPILACAAHEEGLRRMPVSPTESERHAFAPLEALGRLLCGLAPWLECPGSGAQPAERDAVRQLIHLSIRKGSGRLEFSHGTQPLVDAAFLAQAVLRAPTTLWSELTEAGRTDLVDALSETRRIKAHFNNWLLFAAMIEAMFCRMGCEWDRARVDYALRQHDAWYVGDGVFSDGPHFRVDYFFGCRP